jgi:hypothetical protein
VQGTLGIIAKTQTHVRRGGTGKRANTMALQREVARWQIAGVVAHQGTLGIIAKTQTHVRRGGTGKRAKTMALQREVARWQIAGVVAHQGSRVPTA